MILNGIKWEPLAIPEGINDDMPYATHSGLLDLGNGQSLRCYQLSNGMRVFDSDDVEQFFDGMEVEGE